MSAIATTSYKVAAVVLCAGLAAGIGVRADVALGTASLAAVAASIAQNISGVIPNFLHELLSGVSEWLGGKRPQSSHPPDNDDLDYLAARAILQTLSIARAHARGNEAIEGFCTRIAAATEEQVVAILRSDAFRELDDTALLAVLGMSSGGQTSLTKTPDYWIRFVAALAGLTQADILRRRTSAAIQNTITEIVLGESSSLERDPHAQHGTEFVAGWVHQNLAAQSNDILRDVFGPKGRPYVAAQMLYANKMLRLLATEAQKNDVRHAELLPAVKDLQCAADRLAAILGTMLDDAIAPLLRAANDNLALSRQLLGVLDGIQGSLYEIGRGTGEAIQLLTSGPRIKPLALPPGSEPGTLSGARRIDFILRDAELRELLAFLTSDQRVSWQLWHGAAGMGKSRLGFELCRLVDCSWEEKPSVWAAGFLDLPRVRVGDWTHWKITRPTLIVVDYALERAEETKSLIEQVVQDAQRKAFPPVRFLLLEREHNDALLNQVLPSGDADGWMASAVHRGSDGIAQPIRALRPFAKHDLVRIVEAVYAARQRAAPAHRASVALPDAKAVAAKFQSSTLELRPLFAILAAEAAIEGKDPAALHHEGLARDWLGHECRAWRKHFSAGEVGQHSYQRHVTLVALATLAQGLPCPQGFRALHATLETCGTADLLPSADAFAANWKVLEHFYSLGKTETPETVPALRPDYLGELFVLDHFQKEVSNGIAQRALLRTALILNPTGTLQFLRHIVHAHTAHPTVRNLVQELDELMTQDAKSLQFARRTGELDLLLGTTAGKLGMTELKWRSFERASQIEAPQSTVLRLLAEQYLAAYWNRDTASALLQRWAERCDATFTSYFNTLKYAHNRGCNRESLKALLAALEKVGYPNAETLVSAGGYLAGPLNDNESAKRLLSRVEKIEGVSGEVLCQSAAYLAGPLNNKDTAKRLLARLENREDVHAHIIVVAGGLLAGPLNDNESAKRLLSRIEKMEGVSGEVLCQAARHLAGPLNDNESAKRFLSRIEKMEGVTGHVLCQAAGHLAGPLNDNESAKRFLSRIEKMEGVSGEILCQAAGHLAGPLNDNESAKRFLSRIEKMEEVSGHALLVAAQLLAHPVGAHDLAEALLARLLILPNVETRYLHGAARVCRLYGFDRDLTERIEAQAR